MLVKPFGLKTGNVDAEQLEKALRSGKDSRMLPVVGKTDNETAISMDDKHLKAYFALCRSARNPPLHPHRIPQQTEFRLFQANPRFPHACREKHIEEGIETNHHTEKHTIASNNKISLLKLSIFY